jgi:glyoxylase-like metal-dependent hydrolase (beta-lactamase superfamily II)
VPGGKWVLVDAGLFGSANKIKAEAEKIFGPGTKPQAIVLTHGHFDHVGALQDLLKEWDVPVYAHPLEMPYLTGKSHYPPPDPGVGGGAMAYMSFLFPTNPINLGNRLRPIENNYIPELYDWRVIPTPGHSPGHISLFRDKDRVLIAGDAFVTVNQASAISVMTQKKELLGPPTYFTIDWEASRQSVERLASLYPTAAGTGHGVPMFGEELTSRLSNLVEHFDEIAIPSSGRYVTQPAITDEEGIITMPTPISNNAAKIIAGVGLGVAVGAIIFSIFSNPSKGQKRLN